MKIISKGNALVATFPPAGVQHKWLKGSHTVNVWYNGRNIDCYTFAWHKDKTSMLDFTSAMYSYLED